jgi:hypothetical protein
VITACFHVVQKKTESTSSNLKVSTYHEEWTRANRLHSSAVFIFLLLSNTQKNAIYLYLWVITKKSHNCKSSKSLLHRSSYDRHCTKQCITLQEYSEITLQHYIHNLSKYGGYTPGNAVMFAVCSILSQYQHEQNKHYKKFRKN